MRIMEQLRVKAPVLKLSGVYAYFVLKNNFLSNLQGSK